MRKGYFVEFYSRFTDDDISFVFIDLARKESRIEYSDLAFIPYRVNEADIIDSFASSHKDIFLDDLAFGSSYPLFIENQFIQVSDARPIFIGSREILQKIFDGHNSLFSQYLDVLRSCFEKLF